MNRKPSNFLFTILLTVIFLASCGGGSEEDENTNNGLVISDPTNASVGNYVSFRDFVDNDPYFTYPDLREFYREYDNDISSDLQTLAESNGNPAPISGSYSVYNQSNILFKIVYI